MNGDNYDITMPSKSMTVDSKKVIVVKGGRGSNVKSDKNHPILEPRREYFVQCNVYNIQDLSDYDFTDAISIVIGTPWPRIMTFERPAAEPVPDAEGWLFKQGSESTSTF